ncbi:hypothetical protein [Paenibacillus dendritiformis]|nr:hypothetical protein [Paenibacillus dendritiformis]CAH8771212.1 hypothetical protein H7S4_003947 [Paenibacillus dendritiformis]
MEFRLLACTADEPSGIRMDSGQKATQIAIGTLLAAACTRGITRGGSI